VEDLPGPVLNINTPFPLTLTANVLFTPFISIVKIIFLCRKNVGGGGGGGGALSPFSPDFGLG